MVGAGETIADRRGAPRAMGYGDVLILVRRRNALFHEIIRELKRQNVPVGGADRMLLSEHIAFQDLVALGHFARFADDDLTLAALLRHLDFGPMLQIARQTWHRFSAKEVIVAVIFWGSVYTFFYWWLSQLL